MLLLRKLHSLIYGRKGRQVALVVRYAVEDGYMMMPTFAAMQREFGAIGSRQGYQHYLNSQNFLTTASSLPSRSSWRAALSNPEGCSYRPASLQDTASAFLRNA